ncbi:MAG: alanine racemase [Polyangiaceae bacterium]
MALSYEELAAAVVERSLPAVVVDLDAFDRNVERHTAVLGGSGLTLRVASKSLRVVELLKRVLGASPVMRGVLCFTAREALALGKAGLDDLLVAYPSLEPADHAALVELARRGARACAVADSNEAVDALSHAALRGGVTLDVVACVDMSLRVGPFAHVGVRRSPLHTVEEVVAFAERARERRGLRVRGVLAYEAQVAGLGDDSPFDPRGVRAAKALLRRTSMRELAGRRTRIVAALRGRGFDLALVNGGGTGSLEWTTPDTGVTEVAAGSGFYKPLLFDGYRSPFVRSLEPSCFFALQATRRPAPDIVTCLGGGYVASGAVGPDKLPRPVLPTGLELLSVEGAGEVQTPVQGENAKHLPLGAPVFFRHAKAGEIMERFAEVVLVRNGREEGRVPTYRGEGLTFV